MGVGEQKKRKMIRRRRYGERKTKGLMVIGGVKGGKRVKSIGNKKMGLMLLLFGVFLP